jgi:hypothetical protein
MITGGARHRKCAHRTFSPGKSLVRRDKVSARAAAPDATTARPTAAWSERSSRRFARGRDQLTVMVPAAMFTRSNSPGYEIVEGAVTDGRIREVRRAGFAPQALAARH